MRRDCRNPLARKSAHARRPPWRAALVAGLAFYLLSYAVLSRIGQSDGVASGKVTVWAFQDLSRSHNVVERALFLAYYPLIRMDRAFRHRHVLDGGAEVARSGKNTR